MKRLKKTALLSLVFFLVFAGNIFQAFADYENFRTLFNPRDSSATLGGPAWITDPTGTVRTPVGAAFTFRGGFNTVQNTPAKTAEWYWNHVKGNQNVSQVEPNAFLSRICKLDSSGNPVDTQCAFIKVPFENRPSTNICTSSNGFTANCTNEQLDDAYRKTIYIYDVASDVQTTSGESIYPVAGGRLIGNEFNKDFAVNIVAQRFYILPNTTASTLQEIPFSALYDNSPTSQYKAELWYCSARPTIDQNTDTPPNQSQVDPNDPGIKFFGRLCGGESDRSYFKIAETSLFQIPQDISQIDPSTLLTVAGETEANNQAEINAAAKSFLPACDILNGYRPLVEDAPVSSGTFMGCLAQLTYHLIYRPVSWFAGIMGDLFDFFLGYSLSDDSYRAEFAVKGWQLVRDISNIFFIIILVWTGLSAVFNTGTNMKRVVAQLILNALLINFSLFATRVVIDLSNIVSRVFYNSVETCKGECVDADNDGKPDNPLESSGGHKGLSVAITSGFNPQNIFKQNVIDSAQAVPSKFGGGVEMDKQNEREAASDKAGYFIIVSLIAALIMFGVAKMFWGVAFMFLGRVIGLYLVMIFAPFAVLTRGGMPLLGNIPNLSWDNWLKELTSYATLAPIFVFFLYIISSFITSGFMGSILKPGDSFFESVISVSIPMLIVYFMLQQGVNIAKKYSGMMGKVVQDFVNKNIVGAAGLAAGGAAIGLRGASLLANKGTKAIGLDKWAAKNAGENGFARSINKALNWSQTSSMDVRNAGLKIGKKEFTAGGLFSSTFGKMGADEKDKISGAVGIGQKDYLGGNVKIQKDRMGRKEEKLKNKIKYGHLSDTEAKEVWKSYMEKQASIAGDNNWENHIDKNDDIKVVIEKIDKLKSEETELNKKLAEATTAGNFREKMNIENRLTANKNSQNAESIQLQSLRENTIKNYKENGIDKDSEAYKSAVNSEKERLDGFGDIKDGKSLESAMRSEYARNLRQNSLWMENGSQNPLLNWLGMAGGGSASTIAASLAGLGGFISGGIGGVVAAHISQLQDEFDEVTKNVMNSHKKSMGKGTDIGKATERLQTLESKIKEAYKQKFGTTIDDLSTVTEEKIEEAIDTASDKIKVQINKLKAKPNKTADEEMELVKAEREYNKLSNLMKDWDNQKTKVSNLNRQKKQDEDKNKEKKDKPKDDKDK